MGLFENDLFALLAGVGEDIGNWREGMFPSRGERGEVDEDRSGEDESGDGY